MAYIIFNVLARSLLQSGWHSLIIKTFIVYISEFLLLVSKIYNSPRKLIKLFAPLFITRGAGKYFLKILSDLTSEKVVHTQY